MNDACSDGPGDRLITMRGRFTFADYQAFRGLLDDIRASGARRHVLDLAEVEFIDSAAIGMLLIAAEEAKRHGGRVALRRPQGQVRRTLDTASLDTVFPIDR